MLYIPAGDFIMGRASNTWSFTLQGVFIAPADQPRPTLYLNGFWMDRTEVTNAMFARFVTETGYQTEAEKAGGSMIKEWIGTGGYPVFAQGADWQHPHGPDTNISGMENHPVVQVSWNDAAAYCAWAGRGLPTAPQWEKAAFGADTRRYPWGNQIEGLHLNFYDRQMWDKVRNAAGNDYNWDQVSFTDDGYQFTAPVGSFRQGASPYGNMDMAGNVAEWVADWFYPGYYTTAARRNPAPPPDGWGERLALGGSWLTLPRAGEIFDPLWFGWDGVTEYYPNHYNPAQRFDFLGFRCAQQETP